jgi:hypothetical protein
MLLSGDRKRNAVADTISSAHWLIQKSIIFKGSILFLSRQCKLAYQRRLRGPSQLLTISSRLRLQTG